ncbi:glycosyltransferase [Francisella philomiragia]|uniref:glycosyltransferase n=1 Tax=Francisella philomiragia TaxID=28110 RepID=UPI0035129FB7
MSIKKIPRQSEIVSKWKSNNVLLSICCITYNHEKFIAEALDSFLIQETNFAYEIVIGEDCSSDNTLEIINQYKQKYSNIIKLVTDEYNVGVSENLKRTLAKCRGNYIAYCEGDDYWTDPHKLQKQVDFLENNFEYVICYTGVKAISENGSSIDDYVGGAECDLASIEMLRGAPINTLTTVFRNVIKEFPPEFNFTMIADMFIWSLLSEYGQGKYLDGVSPSVHRRHGGGVHSLVGEKHRSLMNLTLFSSLLKYHYSKGCSDDLKNYFLSKIDSCLNGVTLEKISSSNKKDEIIKNNEILIREKNNALEYLEKDLGDYKEQVNRIYNSLGWKITKPLRAGVRLIRRIF